MSILSMDSKDIIELLQTPIHDERKDTFGEVHTPMHLIDEILDAIPQSAFTHSEWKWLEPSAGAGNFALGLYLRLLKGLSKKIPSIEKRKRHILDNMLYLVEYNKDNVALLKKRFGTSCHIIHADFLEYSFKGLQFDGVVGNPPFQVPKKTRYKGSVGNRTLWPFFIRKILENGLLKPNRYFGFLTPSSWRRPHSKDYSLMVQDNHLHYLHIFSKKEGKTMLGVQTRFDIYVVQKGNHHKGLSTVIDEKGARHEIDLGKWPFLPNYAYAKFRKVLVPENKGIPILFDSSCYDARNLSKNKTKRNSIPVVHNITRKGLGIQYGKKRCAHLHKPKVLLNFNEKQYPVNDYLGKYGMSQLTFGIPIQSRTDGEKWIAVIESTFFQDLLKASKWSSFQTDYRMFSYFTMDKSKYR
jgi:hypothetical protein